MPSPDPGPCAGPLWRPSLLGHGSSQCKAFGAASVNPSTLLASSSQPGDGSARQARPWVFTSNRSATAQCPSSGRSFLTEDRLTFAPETAEPSEVSSPEPVDSSLIEQV